MTLPHFLVFFTVDDVLKGVEKDKKGGC